MEPLKRRNYDLLAGWGARDSESLYARKVPVVDGGDIGVVL